MTDISNIRMKQMAISVIFGLAGLVSLVHYLHELSGHFLQ